jgi:hypothetical protein
MSLPFRFNGTLNRFEETSREGRKRVYTGLHRYMEQRLFPPGVTEKTLYEGLRRCVAGSAEGKEEKKQPSDDGMAFGSAIHEKIAILANDKNHAKTWNVRALKSQPAEWQAYVPWLAAFIELTEEKKLTPLWGDLPVGDATRLHATAVDFLGTRPLPVPKRDEPDEHHIIELKVFRSIDIADYTDEHTPKLRYPFDPVPCTPGFLAEVQAAQTLLMFNRTFPKRAMHASAAVVIIDRSTAKAHWRPVSQAATLVAAEMDCLFDLERSGALSVSALDALQIAREAKRDGRDYKEVKEEKQSEVSKLLQDIHTALSKAKLN